MSIYLTNFYENSFILQVSPIFQLEPLPYLNGMENKNLHILIPLADFKAVLGIDDREDKLSRFCLITATYAIEHYCMRRLLRKKHFEHIEFTGDLLLPLREYPVREVLAAYVTGNRERGSGNEEIIEPEFYLVIPDCGSNEDIPFALSLSPALKLLWGCKAVKVVYWAGYATGKAPPDLASACLELAAWNIGRYRGRRIGITGNIRGSGRDGEHFEMSMPMQVRQLLEPYRKKTI